MAGKTQFDAIRQIRYLLKNSLNGSKTSIKIHVNRAEKIAASIWCRWHETPATWRLKHLLWFLNHSKNHLSQSTQYNYYLTIVRIINVQKKHNWIERLNGIWCKPK